MNNPLVSIIICCYNRGHLLPQTMESVFAQEYEPVEILVYDDGSTDNTPELMASYGERVRYVWNKNQGIAAARNNACRLAKGEFIAFQDDDDIMPPKRIVWLYDALCQYPEAVFAMGDWACIDDEGNFTGVQTNFRSKLGMNNDEETFLIEDVYKALLWSYVTAVPHSTLFLKLNGERIGWFDTHFFHACEDTDFFARLGKLGPVVYVPQVVSHYRVGHNQLWNNSFLSAYSHFMLYEKHFKTLNSSQSDLKKRLQIRILDVLKSLFYHHKLGEQLPESIPQDYFRRGTSLLNRKERIALMSYKYIKYPIRRLLN